MKGPAKACSLGQVFVLFEAEHAYLVHSSGDIVDIRKFKIGKQ
jgi:hypothetical protein